VKGRWLVGALGLAGVAAWFRRRRRAEPAVAAASPAQELRRKLDESRQLVDEQREADSAETPVDLDERRRSVHEAGRAAVDEMKGEP
jgi:hypothetical protein